MTFRLALILVGATTLVGTACAGPSDQDPSAARRAALAEARARWAVAGIHDYTMTVEAAGTFCYECGTFEVRVAGDQVVEVARTDDGSPHPPDALAPRGLFTIDGQFAWIEQRADGDRFTVTYDANTGAPTAASSDPSLATTDDERSFTVRNLRPSS